MGSHFRSGGRLAHRPDWDYTYLLPITYISAYPIYPYFTFSISSGYTSIFVSKIYDLFQSKIYFNVFDGVYNIHEP